MFVCVVYDTSRAYEFYFYCILLQLRRKYLAELMLVSRAVRTAAVCGYVSTEWEPMHGSGKRFDHIPNRASLSPECFDWEHEFLWSVIGLFHDNLVETSALEENSIDSGWRSYSVALNSLCIQVCKTGATDPRCYSHP